MFDPGRETLVADGLQTALLYKHGYLHFADTLCLWERELVRADALIDGTSPDVPGCTSF